MNILEQIAADKRLEVEDRKQEVPVEALELLPHYSRTCLSMSSSLRNSSSGIIAEFKRRSPSLPDLHPDAEVGIITKGYEAAGAAGISVLTDEKYFGGSIEDLIVAREQVKLPLLRKDFIIDAYQIYEAKAIGADVILLIAAILDREEILLFSKIAHELGLEVLLEVHNEKELEQAVVPGLDMIGINNRNLKNFEVNLGISKSLAKKLPPEVVKVSESGISDTAAITELQQWGFQGFLIGGNFMATQDPGGSAAAFIRDLKTRT